MHGPNANHRHRAHQRALCTGDGARRLGVEIGAVKEPLVRSSEPWLADGEIGDLVITPETGARDGALSVRVALGLRGKPASACTDEGDGQNCIIARRKLAFVPHTRLRLPVVLYLACEGVKCDENTTCSNLGTCVPAAIASDQCASAEGCSLPGEPPFSPVPPGRVDSGVDSGSPDSQISDAAPQEAAPEGGFALSLVRSVGLGASHTCEIGKATGRLKCWGNNALGQLGLGDKLHRGDAALQMGNALPAVDLGTGAIAVDVVGGLIHTCALLSTGKVKCWGENSTGQLGLGDKVPRGLGPGQMGDALPFVDLGTGARAVRLAASDAHTCALMESGQLKCWGDGTFGQLGLGDALGRGDAPGTMGDALPLVDLGPGRTVVHFSLGPTHTCAVLDTGELKCWGSAAFGALGLGDTLARGSGPGQMGAALPRVDLLGVAALGVAAGNDRTCVYGAGALIKCWGIGDEGGLGLGDELQRGHTPGTVGANLPQVNIGAFTSVAGLFGGLQHVCALAPDRTARCWGNNLKGQLGLGDVVPRGNLPGQMNINLPAVELGTGRSIVEMALGDGHSCARLDNGALKCWGDNANGQLGLGDNAPRGVGPGQMGDNLPAVVVE